MHYDKLLIATGGSPDLGLVLRPYKKHIHFYYSLYDTLVLKEKLPEIQKCIVFGDGVSCLDLICVLHNLGKQVTYITKGERATFALDEYDFEGELHEFLEEKGIEIITEDLIVSIEESDRGYKVETIQQKVLTTDIVFAWDYYKPNISCIEGSAIEKELGILVNTRLETSEEDIYCGRRLCRVLSSRSLKVTGLILDCLTHWNRAKLPERICRDKTRNIKFRKPLFSTLWENH